MRICVIIFFGVRASIIRIYVEMSLYGWFAPSKQAAKPYLPDPSKEGSEKEALKVEAADQCVERELGRKRRGVYNHYDPELRA